LTTDKSILKMLFYKKHALSLLQIQFFQTLVLLTQELFNHLKP